MQFLEDVMDLIDSLNLGVKISTPNLKSDNSIAIRLAPSSPENYIAGFTYNLSFQILTQFVDTRGPTSLNNCYAIMDALHNQQNSFISEQYKCISLQCTTLPNYVETTDGGYHVYTAIFNAEIEF